MSKNDIQTWTQGHFIDNPRYKGWTEKEKEMAEIEENFLVRGSALGNVICKATDPVEAKWIAERLNRAAELDQFINSIQSEIEMLCLKNEQAYDTNEISDSTRSFLITENITYRKVLDMFSDFLQNR